MLGNPEKDGVRREKAVKVAEHSLSKASTDPNSPRFP